VNILRALGCAGAVTNGSVRDLPAVRDLGFQMFAGGPTVSHVYLHIVEVAAPVLVGGLTVQSGDLLHGDRHGVQLVPLAAASRIPEVAARQRALDHAVIALCRSSDFTLTKLRALVSQPHS